MKWREDAKKKAVENSSSSFEDPECTFQPKNFTKNGQKKFSGPAMEKGISNHVLRQNRARQGKDNARSPIKTGSGKNSSLLPVEAMKESNLGRTSFERKPTPTPPSSPISPDHASTQDVFRQESSEYDDETVVEMLERERKEWQSDRVKLIHCIHLQQLELTQRAVASHEKATDIAKEFARAIEGFEERLVSVENNVHKEISAIKSIAETLLQSSSMKDDAGDRNSLTPVERRVITLEKNMEKILNRLDNISANLSGNKSSA